MPTAFCASSLALHRTAIVRASVLSLRRTSCLLSPRYHPLLPSSSFLPVNRLGLASKRHEYHSLSKIDSNRRNSGHVCSKGGQLDAAQTPSAINSTTVAELQNAPLSYGSVEDLLSEYNSLNATDRTGKPLADLIRTAFPFRIDQFQNDALRALSAGESVVLSAPTGAGKTIVGEMAIYLALCRRMRVFYTTPLKALSNQKFYDFKKQFGEERVGLLTGDVTVNRDAEIVVMTTEIYRNMLYADSTESKDVAPVTDELFAVVFDEFHYLNDRDRGTVWEEAVISSPEHVLLVALSATMSNTADVRDWFASVQGPTALVESDIRPVPLNFAYCDRAGVTPLFEERREKNFGKRKRKGFGRNKKEEEQPKVLKLHPKLLRKLKESKDFRASKERKNDTEEERHTREVTQERFRKIVDRGRRRDEFKEIPSYPFVVRSLRRRDMLPCIVFIFSRKGCDQAAKAAARERELLVTMSEQEQIKKKIDSFALDHPGMVQRDRAELALQGIASHHAGLLPLWKICVEELFQEGLIKVVFATETLAAGINMPARTTVISTLSKRAGEEGIVSLTTSQVLQMAGRAGRRGKDVLGHSVVLKSRSEGPMDAFKVLTAGVDALESKFTPSYGMVLNLLSARPLSEAKKLVDRSFGNFLRQKRIEAFNITDNSEDANSVDNFETVVREKEGLENVLEEARRIIKTADEKVLRSYIKNFERVKAEKRALTYLEQQSFSMETELIEETLTFAPTGTKILLRNREKYKSAGPGRRQQRRDYSAAVNAAGGGDEGSELRSFYLEASIPDLDLIEEDHEENSHVSEAILLDMHFDTFGILPTFCAVDGNGVLRLFNHTAVSKILYEDDSIDVNAVASGWDDERLPTRNHWQSIGGDQYVVTLPESLAGLVPVVQEWQKQRQNSASSSIAGDVSLEAKPEISAQRERLRYAKDLVRNHELHNKEETGMLLAAKRAIPRIEATLDGRADPFGNKRRQGKNERFNRYARVKTSSREGGNGISIGMNNSSWDDFMNLVSVLQHYGFIDESFNVTSLGSLGAKVRADNELWTSLVLLEPEIENISPVSLGALLGATQMESSRSDAYVSKEVSDEVKDNVVKFAAERVRLHAVQSEFGVGMGLSLDADLMGLVEMWASGMSWVELLSNTSLQEGDACRVLRRVLDVLRQIQHLPVVGENLKKNARRAIALLDRFPVTDDRTYTVRPSETSNESEPMTE